MPPPAPRRRLIPVDDTPTDVIPVGGDPRAYQSGYQSGYRSGYQAPVRGEGGGGPEGAYREDARQIGHEEAAYAGEPYEQDGYDEYDGHEYDEHDYDGHEYDEHDYEEDLAEEERAEPEYIDPPDDADPPKRRRGGDRKRRPKVFRWVAALAVIAVIGGGAWYGIQAIFGYADFSGDGDSDVVIQIADGDSTNAIGAELTNAGVVASAKAFVKASAGNAKVLSLQPGYYVVKTKMSGAAAVARLTASDARVGELQIRAGTQLDDVTQPDGKVTPGAFTLLSKASCATLNGQSTCLSTDDLRKAAASADLAAMGVPDWAASRAPKSGDARRVEGLIAPGVYDVKPGWSTADLLGYVLKSSATKIQAAGLGPSSTFQGQNPYQLLEIASLIEREGVTQDFTKISRVLYNRLAQHWRLGLDSTVNYLLDKPVVTTTDDDRDRPGVYNTYSFFGLPPTPIGAPSPDAIKAALQPADGDWMFFVKCEKNGLSCFAVTYPEHNKNIDLAKEHGAY
ncbi:ABC transporter substrate-binding protein [Amycolatopsis rhizosphaerae]|uniref:Endolytic murein transglycosylase n=1 Tax=Amycolatopsis rhizosphaerae TaxID=2053003 RepID=A0A558APR0_9PSEU|nr:ABC transporter substrate-binding protein [Amycolatopsis rhizosphaerae]